jgi:hypothetical protein
MPSNPETLSTQELVVGSLSWVSKFLFFCVERYGCFDEIYGKYMEIYDMIWKSMKFMESGYEWMF